MSKTVDSAKSQVDELTNLCLSQSSQQSGSEETPCNEVSEEIINWDQLIDRFGDGDLIEQILSILLPIQYQNLAHFFPKFNLYNIQFELVNQTCSTMIEYNYFVKYVRAYILLYVDLVDFQIR